MRYLMVMLIFQFTVIPQGMADETIGRLFFTPEQRQHLERLRVDTQQHSVAPELDAKAIQSSSLILPELKIQGYVKRNDDKQSTRWVNGKPLQDDEIE